MRGLPPKKLIYEMGSSSNAKSRFESPARSRGSLSQCAPYAAVHIARSGTKVPLRGRPDQRYHLLGQLLEASMEWTTPSFEEINLNCEISSYVNAEL